MLLEGWARDGLTEEQITEKMGISRSSLSDWKSKYPDILDTLKKGKVKEGTLSKSLTDCKI